VRLSLAIALFLAAAIGLTACGSGASVEDEVREAAEKAVASEKPAAFCRQLVSDRLLEEVFGGDLAACVKSDIVEDDPGQPHVSAVVPRGEDETRAEAAVRIAGGELGGVAGHLEFAKEGDEWRLDRYGDDYLRSNFLVAIGKADEGAFRIESMKSCVGGQVEQLPAARLRQISNDSASDDKAFFEDLRTLSEKCPRALAEYGARELTDPLYETGKRSPAFIRCVREEIESYLLLTDITPQLLGEKPDEIAVAALAGIVEGSKKNCLQR
jgi:hypothetical protein